LCSQAQSRCRDRARERGRPFQATTADRVAANGSPLVATSAQRAYVGQVGFDLAMSRDGGRTFTSVLACPRDSSGARLQCDPVFLGFSDAAVGYYIRTVQPTESDPVIHTQFWRTTDAGFSWRQVRFPS